MRKNPKDRFQSAAETLAHLEECTQRSVGSPDGPQSPQLVAGHLFGRTQELIQLQESFCTASAAMNETPCLVVRGPSGAGKTRLVQEVRGLVQVSRGAYVEIPGRPFGAAPIDVAELILRGLETSGINDLDSVREALVSLPTDSPDIERTIVDTVLHKSHGVPILLSFDDFQRAPARIRSLALRIARTARENLVSGTARPKLLVVLSWSTDDGRGDFSNLQDLPAIDLKPFEKDVARAFVQQLFGQEDIHEEMLQLILDCAHGNPGRLVELASDLVDSEVVQHSGSRWIFPVTT